METRTQRVTIIADRISELQGRIRRMARELADARLPLERRVEIALALGEASADLKEMQFAVRMLNRSAKDAKRAAILLSQDAA